ncbi:MAG: dethiobiotin synthase [Pseudolabrys sp.]
MSAVFVTATGTDIGKTFVTAGLIRLLRDQGANVTAFKPVVSGYDSSVVETSDPAVLLDALGRAVSAEEIERIAPWRYRAPVAPDLAAAREGRPLDFEALTAFCRRAIETHKGTLFIEGVGGIMAPLDARRTVLDWMTVLRLPLLLVVGSYLGSISHTLTALHVLTQRKLNIAAIMVSESERSPVSLEATVESILHFASGIEVIGLPRLVAGLTEHPAFAQAAKCI